MKGESIASARNIVNKYGKKYGWEWNKDTGLINKATSYGKTFIDQWDIINDMASGDKQAAKLANALIKLSKYELRQSIYNIERRKNKGETKAEQMYSARAHELMQKQLTRLRDEKNKATQLLEIQNIHRESSEKAFRQTPKQRGSKAGIRERAEKSLDQINIALASKELIVKTDVLSYEEYMELAELAKVFDINLDEIAERHKVSEGNPYKALEKAYTEVSELIESHVKNLSAEEKEEILATPAYARLIESYGVDF